MAIICIDPGHSGQIEPGCCYGDLHEADIVLAFALLLRAALEDLNHTVHLTRTGEIDTDGLGFRADLANRLGADAFISIHVNAAENPLATGAEVYYYRGSREGCDLANAINAAMRDMIPSRGVKPAGFYVLRETYMPAALLELAFLSNEGDRQLLQNFAWQQACARRLAAGIDVWLQNNVGD